MWTELCSDRCNVQGSLSVPLTMEPRQLAFEALARLGKQRAAPLASAGRDANRDIQAIG
jgi:hypothetical protein